MGAATVTVSYLGSENSTASSEATGTPVWILQPWLLNFSDRVGTGYALRHVAGHGYLHWESTLNKFSRMSIIAYIYSYIIYFIGINVLIFCMQKKLNQSMVTKLNVKIHV